jgi:hypothetical protein
MKKETLIAYLKTIAIHFKDILIFILTSAPFKELMHKIKEIITHPIIIKQFILLLIFLGILVIHRHIQDIEKRRI